MGSEVTWQNFFFFFLSQGKGNERESKASHDAGKPKTLGP